MTRLRTLAAGAGYITLIAATVAAANTPILVALAITWAGGTIMHSINTAARPRPTHVHAAEPAQVRRGPGAAPRSGDSGCGTTYTSVAASPRHGRHRAGRAIADHGRPVNARPTRGVSPQLTYRVGRAPVGGVR